MIKGVQELARRSHYQTPCVHIQNLMEHQEINKFLKVSTYYNEDLTKVFYDGLKSREGSTFRFKMRNNSYHFTGDSWREVFGIFVLSHQVILSGHAFHPNFDWKSNLNSCLKAPRPNDNFDKLSTGSLKKDPRIL